MLATLEQFLSINYVIMVVLLSYRFWSKGSCGVDGRIALNG
jgi:hypothetical protein